MVIKMVRKMIHPMTRKILMTRKMKRRTMMTKRRMTAKRAMMIATKRAMIMTKRTTRKMIARMIKRMMVKILETQRIQRTRNRKISLMIRLKKSRKALIILDPFQILLQRPVSHSTTTLLQIVRQRRLTIKLTQPRRTILLSRMINHRVNQTNPKIRLPKRVQLK